MKSIPITQVRFNEAEGRARLARFLTRDRYRAAIVPRGVEPSLVSTFAREHITPESDPDVYFRILDLMRFYERADLLQHLVTALRGERHPEESAGLLRAVCVLEATGDFGTAAEISQAVVHLDQLISTHPAAIPALGVLSESIIALASDRSLQRLSQRLSDRVARAAQAQHNSTDAMRDYQQLRSLEQNDLPKVKLALEAKRRLVATSQPQRRPQLVATYLRRTLFSSPQLEVWSARLLRAEAMREDPQPVYAAFGQAMDAMADDSSNPQFRAFVIERAGQAILYLQGTLSTEQGILLYESDRRTPNFLWDDL